MRSADHEPDNGYETVPSLSVKRKRNMIPMM